MRFLLVTLNLTKNVIFFVRRAAGLCVYHILAVKYSSLIVFLGSCEEDGMIHDDGEEWSPLPCTKCVCQDGASSCYPIQCPPLICPPVGDTNIILLLYIFDISILNNETLYFVQDTIINVSWLASTGKYTLKTFQAIAGK